MMRNRIAEFIEGLGMNPRQFAMSIGVDPVGVYRLVRDSHLLPTANLQRKIKQAYPHATMMDIVEPDDRTLAA